MLFKALCAQGTAFKYPDGGGKEQKMKDVEIHCLWLLPPLPVKEKEKGQLGRYDWLAMVGYQPQYEAYCVPFQILKDLVSLHKIIRTPLLNLQEAHKNTR